MAPRKIIGVDFSGGNEAKGVKTWVTEGYYDGGKLTLCCCYPIGRDGLEKLLMNLPNRAVAAMDFPFSVPLAFAAELGLPKSTLPTLWAKIASIKTLEEFKTNAQCYTKFYRVGDLEHPDAQPPLKPQALTMINMTFYGMQMLHRLYSTKNYPRFEVPPLVKPDINSPVLLEVMPGLALHAFALASERYKTTKASERENRSETRRKILRILGAASGIQLAENDILDHIKHKCIQDSEGDALDSLVAAIVAAKWAQCRSDFRVPPDEVIQSLKRGKREASYLAKDKRNIDVAKTEGWIYVPK